MKPRDRNLQLIRQRVREDDAVAHARESAGTEVARDAFEIADLPRGFPQDDVQKRKKIRVVHAPDGRQRNRPITVNAGQVALVGSDINGKGTHETSI